jgi:outer membrane protein assembly factor BamD (BamD/ComL family)
MRPSIRLCSVSLLVLPLLTACGQHYGRPDKPSSQLAFGVDMAKKGLWSEAMFRFRQAESLEPDNPRVQNNLGVASEAAGDYDKALDYYKKALKLDPNSKDLRANYARFVEFYQGFKGTKSATAAAPAGTAAPPPSRTPPPTPEQPPAGNPVGTPEPVTPGPPPPPAHPAHPAP